MSEDKEDWPEGSAGSGSSPGHRPRGAVPELPNETWWTRLWKPFWVLPAVCVLGALALAIWLPRLEESLDTDVALSFVFQGGPDGAREVLGTIAAAMISVTGLIFSITMVVLQLASNQFSPRVLGEWLQNRVVQGTLGVFLSTFVFALTVIRYVRGDNEGAQFVPQISVTVAFAMALTCIGFFLAFIHAITRSIQVGMVVSGIGDRTLALADKLYPEQAEEDSPSTGPTWSPDLGAGKVSPPTTKHGILTHVDYVGLLRWAQDHDVVVVVNRPVGQFVTEGQELLTVWGVDELGEEETRKVSSYLGLGPQRDMVQDVAFGIRQLVDIADRALSSGINDPTTAVQCLDELHRILRRLVQRASPSPYIADDDGQVRVVHHPQSVNDLVDLALREIAFFGGDTLQVPRRLRLLLDDLLEASASRYRAHLKELSDELPRPKDGEHGGHGASEPAGSLR